MSDATTDLTPRGPMRDGAGPLADTVAIGYATMGHLVTLLLRALGTWPAVLRPRPRNRMTRVQDDHRTAGSEPRDAAGIVGAHGVSHLTVV